ncbi:MAG: YggS family pyridoxal phosphate-dependent enzyme [Myxococcaceae bacterium]|nr:YggS family pyridoxal phosphate-dependent enzyme [Myxococcaceae bacterium]
MGIRENLDAIRRRVADAARRAARSPEDVTLVAVSKFQPDAAIVEAYQAGQRLFGENYAQELRDKAQRLGHLPDIDFHFIGRLQRNKAKYAVAAASCVQSLDDLALAEELNRRASSLTKQMGVLVEINFDEAQKGGVSLAELPDFLRALEPLAALRIDGLMAIPPAELSEDESRQVFRALAKAARQNRLKHLSMGMSGDFEIAIEEGATIVRVGTAIFGPRGIT